MDKHAIGVDFSVADNYYTAVVFDRELKNFDRVYTAPFRIDDLFIDLRGLSSEYKTKQVIMDSQTSAMAVYALRNAGYQPYQFHLDPAMRGYLRDKLIFDITHGNVSVPEHYPLLDELHNYRHSPAVRFLPAMILTYYTSLTGTHVDFV